ncbi:P-loop containing nucleoside triphosphate hydrolase protein, partial [Boletus edulis]
RNVIFMGETGSGKSSIINLIAGHNRAAVSNDGMPCTVHFMPYEVSLEGRTYLLWDTPGLTKASESKSRSFRRLRVTQVPEYSLESFLQERCRREELDLFVLCMQGNRVSAETLRIYEIFCRAGRQTTIPLVVAVTRLERIKPTMDAWWQNNEKELAKRSMVFDGHACVTCLSPHQLRSASQQAIHRLISSEYQPRARPPLEKEESPDNSGRGCTIC